VSTASSAIKTAVFTLFVPLVVAGVIPQRMAHRAHAAFAMQLFPRVIGGMLIALGVTGYLWCATLFVRAQGTPAPVSPTKRAVVEGPYRVTRNPMYTSVLAAVFGQALWYSSWQPARYGAVLAVCFHLFVVFYEENDLRARFGAEYEEFCSRVPRWLPRLRG
jgi:protein-S-isoprenylcysteine O-methyltransferase Ste14